MYSVCFCQFIRCLLKMHRNGFGGEAGGDEREVREIRIGVQKFLRLGAGGFYHEEKIEKT